MIGKIVSPYIKKNLLRAYLKQKRTIKFQTFENSKSVGILWNPSDETSVETFEQLRKVLKDKVVKISGIAFIDSKSEKETLATVAHSRFIHKNEVTLFGKPNSTEALQFIEQPFDILIDLTIKKIFALQYVLVHSIAKFKVGWKAYGHNFYDFDIDVTNKPESKYLMEQIIHYLDTIKEKND